MRGRRTDCLAGVIAASVPPLEEDPAAARDQADTSQLRPRPRRDFGSDKLKFDRSVPQLDAPLPRTHRLSAWCVRALRFARGATDAQPRALRVKASRKHASAPQLDVEMAPDDEPVAPELGSTAGLSEPAAPAQPAQRERSRDRRQRRLDALAERALKPPSHRLSPRRGRCSVQAVQSQSHATREPQEARGGGRWRTGRCRRCARGHRQLASSGRCSSVDDRRGVYAQVSEAAEGRGRGCSACVERDRENDRGSAS